MKTTIKKNSCGIKFDSVNLIKEEQTVYFFPIEFIELSGAQYKYVS